MAGVVYDALALHLEPGRKEERCAHAGNPLRGAIWTLHKVVRADLQTQAWEPSLKALPMSAPMGTVHALLASAVHQ